MCHWSLGVYRCLRDGADSIFIPSLSHISWTTLFIYLQNPLFLFLSSFVSICWIFCFHCICSIQVCYGFWSYSLPLPSLVHIHPLLLIPLLSPASPFYFHVNFFLWPNVVTHRSLLTGAQVRDYLQTNDQLTSGYATEETVFILYSTKKRKSPFLMNW